MSIGGYELVEDQGIMGSTYGKTCAALLDRVRKLIVGGLTAGYEMWVPPADSHDDSFCSKTILF